MIGTAVLVLLTAGPVRAFGRVQDQVATTMKFVADQTDKADKPKKADKDTAQDKTPKGNKPKKAKKSKKPKSDVPAPDEKVDPDAVDSGGSGWRASWKQHPSIRYGSVFRLDGG